MKRYPLLLAVLLISACGKPEEKPAMPAEESSAKAVSSPAAGTKSAADLEKEKALKEPYANDLGPEKIDVSGYPKNAQAGYAALQAKCTACHSAARPLNSQFVEPPGKDLAARRAAVERLKASQPALFARENRYVWQVEADIWQRYVKRMMAKPGCEVSKDEGKLIWEFLVHDSSARKLGAKKEEWAAHRRALLTKFQKEHPKRYRELYGSE